MTLSEFINQNKTKIMAVINRNRYRYNKNVPNPLPTYTNKEIRDILVNTEELYNWARSEGWEG